MSYFHENCRRGDFAKNDEDVGTKKSQQAKGKKRWSEAAVKKKKTKNKKPTNDKKDQ